LRSSRRDYCDKAQYEKSSRNQRRYGSHALLDEWKVLTDLYFIAEEIFNMRDARTSGEERGSTPHPQAVVQGTLQSGI